MANPQPVFLTKNVTISNGRPVGRDGKHLKLTINGFDAIWFNASSDIPDFADISYTLEENTWNGQSKLQLVIKEVKSIHG